MDAVRGSVAGGGMGDEGKMHTTSRTIFLGAMERWDQCDAVGRQDEDDV